MDQLATQTAGHLTDILTEAIKLTPAEQALVIFDTDAPLTKIVTEGYRQALPRATFVEFATLTAPDILRMIKALSPNDLVILIQSTNFRLDEFRLRIEIFKLGLKTIEHTHLARITEDQFGRYIEALSYDAPYYRTTGRALKTRLDKAERTVVTCDGTELVYPTQLEDTKLNIGDYTDMKNVGGTFPIGEVFTEAKNLKAVQGEAMVFGFAGEDHVVRTYPPFKVNVTDGILTAPEGPEEFQRILELIKQDEEVLVRELGLGLNRAMGKTEIVNDITAFERQKGVHLSLGAKHAMYAKPGLNRKHGRYHVDIFLDVKRITIDDEVVFADGNYLV